ncbi:MAG: hypothetical protein AABW57_02030 [Nanoarchaeota archaeon]
MGINISAGGYGLAAILGAGAILLSVLGKDTWDSFLTFAVIIFIASTLIRRL